VVPFLPLTELPSHEKELLAGVAEHVAEEQPETGSFLPVVSGHLGEEGMFTVHHFVVRKGEAEILREGVHETERELILVVFSENGIPGKIGQRVVHPPHVPLHTEPEPSHIGGAGDERPRRGLFRYGLGLGDSFVDGFVEPSEKLKRLEVFSAAELVRNPFPILPGVIEIEHGGHGIDPKTVSVIPLQPEESAADEKTPYFAFSEIENVTVPVWVESLARIRVFEEVCSIEKSQAVSVHGKMGGNPVQNDADSLLVESVHQGHEILGSTESARRSKIADALISPGSVERVLHDREKLYMGESHVPNIGNELLREISVAQKSAVPSPPGTKVNFVHGERSVEGISGSPLAHPHAIVPYMFGRPHDGSAPGWFFPPQSKGIPLLRSEIPVVDVIFVEASLTHSGHESLPDSRAVPPGRERVCTTIPAVKIAHNAYAFRIGRPNGEERALTPLHRHGMRTEFVLQTPVVALPEQIDVIIGQPGDAIDNTLVPSVLHSSLPQSLSERQAYVRFLKKDLVRSGNLSSWRSGTL
jgi:hypothetical protein